MRYEIEIEERIKKLNTYVIDVEDEDEGIMVANRIDNDINVAIHPDDVTAAFKAAGVKIIEIEEGAEEFECEMF